MKIIWSLKFLIIVNVIKFKIMLNMPNLSSTPISLENIDVEICFVLKEINAYNSNEHMLNAFKINLRRVYYEFKMRKSTL